MCVHILYEHILCVSISSSINYIIPITLFNVANIPFDLSIWSLIDTTATSLTHHLVIYMKDIMCSINHKSCVVFYSFDMPGFSQNHTIY